jgi:hypothetical protein
MVLSAGTGSGTNNEAGMEKTAQANQGKAAHLSFF